MSVEWLAGPLGWNQFAWPWAFAALLLPLLAYLLLPPARHAGSTALPVPFYTALAAADAAPLSGPRWVRIAALLVWLLLVLAAARPQYVGEQVEVPVTGRDVLMAVDISGSMRQEDMVFEGRRITRLLAVKAVAGEFLTRRVGDRLGLILFGSQAYLQTPLTFDRATTRTLLYEAEIGLAGRETAIGDALGLALKHLQQTESEQKVLILLTDGANTAGSVEPLEAARLAAGEGLTVYTIGIGADARQVNTLFGRRWSNPSADLDEASLRQIAELTGGQYFRARSLQDLQSIYAQLDELEPAAADPEVFRPVSERFYWPLGAALAMALLLGLVQLWPALNRRRVAQYAG